MAGLGRRVNPPGEAYTPCAEFLGRRLAASGFELLDLREPLHPQTGLPASLLLIARCRAVSPAGG